MSFFLIFSICLSSAAPAIQQAIKHTPKNAPAIPDKIHAIIIVKPPLCRPKRKTNFFCKKQNQRNKPFKTSDLHLVKIYTVFICPRHPKTWEVIKRRLANRSTGISPLRGSLRAVPTCCDGSRTMLPLQRSTLWPDRSISPLPVIAVSGATRYL